MGPGGPKGRQGVNLVVGDALAAQLWWAVDKPLDPPSSILIPPPRTLVGWPKTDALLPTSLLVERVMYCWSALTLAYSLLCYPQSSPPYLPAASCAWSSAPIFARPPAQPPGAATGTAGAAGFTL